jgi:hypothetical protein
MQLHVTGGDLVTKSPFRLDPLTGQWRLNAFVKDLEIRVPHYVVSLRSRNWALSLPRRLRPR